MSEYRLPTKLVPHADQAQALADERLTKMIAALRCDLTAGMDPTYLWWTVADGFARSTAPADCATALSTALLRLARTSHDKGLVRRCCPGCWVGRCPCCFLRTEGDHATVLRVLDKHMRTGCRHND